MELYIPDQTFFQNKMKVLSSGKPRDHPGKKNEDHIYSMFNHVTQKYHCPQCDKTFGGKTGLRLHYQIHTGVFSYWCEMCRKGFSVKGNYTAHMAKHEGKTFPCSYCEKGFGTKHSLQKHDCQHNLQNTFPSLKSYYN